MRNRILILSVLFFSLVAGGASSVFSAENSPHVTLNGETVVFSDVKPQTIHDRTYVPFRSLLEALGAKVSWDNEHQVAIAEKYGITVKIPIGGKTLDVNGFSLTMDVPSILKENRTLVPLRFVSQALGASVEWKPTEDGGEIILKNGIQEMLDQLVSGKSGDQKVTLEKAAILFEWLMAQKDQLPPFTGKEVVGGYKEIENKLYGFKFNTNPDYRKYLMTPGKPSYLVEEGRIKTGPYRIQKINFSAFHEDENYNVILDPVSNGYGYIVWDTTFTDGPGGTNWPGKEVIWYIPPKLPLE